MFVQLAKMYPYIRLVFVIACLFYGTNALHNFIIRTNTAEVAAGLSETISGLNPSQLAILIDTGYKFEEIDDFIYLIHKRYYKSLIFYDVEQYLMFIEKNIQGSVETFSLIFGKPYDLVNPTEVGNLQLVNWFDAESLGLYRTPLLPSLTKVYSNLAGRVLRVPVFQSPPWFWVNYENDTSNDSSNDWDYADPVIDSALDYKEVNVTGGRDHRLLTLLATSMNFNFVYIDMPGRTQGSLRTDDNSNTSFTGGIGLLQGQKAHLLLGDVSLSWERRKAVEFSFFTLADSGAFATHAPRRLNEALAILRPFKKDVWPYLILTLALSGPMLYMIIVIPHKLPFQKNKLNGLGIYAEYLNEITPVIQAKRFNARNAMNVQSDTTMPKHLLDRCIWFTVQLFLKQSCSEPYDGYRAKFLMIVFWISATYVLADVYSAQLTSQFARPAHEQPINNLQKLQRAVLHDGYRLYVEKDSSSLEMLQNGTEIFRNLYALMKQQVDYEGYLIDSVEAGIKLIADGLENKVVLGGRETLYFNMKQFGSKTFQLSQKLYTRYSAVAVQLGCPFLDSLNEVLMRLFEGGILDKMTNAEYEALSRLVDQNSNGSMDKFELQEGTNSNTETKKDHKKHENENFEYTIQPINLRMLQGAFIALVFGYGLAGLIFFLEIFFGSRYVSFLQRQSKLLKYKRHKLHMILKRYWKLYFINLVHFLYNRK